MLMSTTWKNMLACWSLNDFFEQLILSFKTLSEMPRMGVPCGFRRPSLSRLRRWPVKDFENCSSFISPRGAAWKLSTSCMVPATSRHFSNS
jgi:hypothetical protein